MTDDLTDEEQNFPLIDFETMMDLASNCELSNDGLSWMVGAERQPIPYPFEIKTLVSLARRTVKAEAARAKRIDLATWDDLMVKLHDADARAKAAEAALADIAEAAKQFVDNSDHSTLEEEG